MSKLIHKSNVFHPMINGVAFTQSACATFSVSGDVTDEQAAVFLALPEYELIAERAPEGGTDNKPADKPETKAQKTAREKAEKAAAEEAEKAAKEQAEAEAAGTDDNAEDGADADSEGEPDGEEEFF